jgi:uncharacterized protein
VLALNADHLEAVSEMDADRFRLLHPMADRVDVVDVGGEVAGFVITFGPGTVYDSANYREFARRYDDFYYLDRIVIAAKFRRHGLATLVYDELERVAARHGRMALEVNTVPANPASLAFHRARGYAEVGILGDESKQVALLVKELP